MVVPVVDNKSGTYVISRAEVMRGRCGAEMGCSSNPRRLNLRRVDESLGMRSQTRPPLYSSLQLKEKTFHHVS